MEFVDTHCHLDMPPLSTGTKAVLARSKDAGVRAVVALSYDLASFDAVERLAELEGVVPALGLHPWMAHEPLNIVDLELRLKKCRAVAIGEIGLDFKIENPDPRRQLEVLELQVDLARRLNLPLLLHCRGAFEELLDVLQNQGRPVRGVLHAFSRGTQLMQRFLETGLHIAFGGAVTRPSANRARQAAKDCPAGRLLLETDAPSIGLEGVPADKVEPRHVREIASSIAALRASSLQEIADLTTTNAAALFGPRLLASNP
jgi:TatD DNase family protein